MAALAFAAGGAPARASEIVRTCGSSPANEVFVHAAVFGINWSQVCPSSAAVVEGGLGLDAPANSVAQGQRGYWIATAPAGLVIRDASMPSMHIGNVNGGNQYGGGFFWGPGNSEGATYTTGTQSAAYGEDYGTAGFPSQTFGFQLVCGANPCTAVSNAYLDEIDLTVDETSGPALTAGGVWGHTGWVRGAWPLSVTGDSPSGVCSLSEGVALPGGDSQIAAGSFPQDGAAWHQCNAGSGISATLNTAGYPDGADTLYVSGSDAAGQTGSATTPLDVDNATPTVSLSTQNDPDLNEWVNHAVTVQAAASAGPSGVAGTSCSVDDGTSSDYPAGGVTVDGDGVHTVSCTASNNAISPQGAPNTGTTSETVKIDEAPPALSFEPVNPSDPTALVVDAGDDESGVAGGSITVQGPHDPAPTALPTTFNGSQLVSRFDDGGKNGDYTFVASSCDEVGNCASTSEVLHFPIRLGSQSLVSFSAIRVPARIVHRRVRVGYRVKTVGRRVRVDYHVQTVVRRRHGKRQEVQIKVGGHVKRVKRQIKVGGHFARIKIRIGVNRSCGHRRVKLRPHHWKEVTACRKLVLRVVKKRRVRFGHRATLHGLLVTAQGAPIADAPVTILTRPNDRGGVFRRAVTTTTDAIGAWTATVPGGPSRTVRAYYGGSATVEPTTSTVQLTVPAKIRLTISPHVLPWSHAIEIRGHLVGRYVPHDGVALRLLVRYPGTRQRTPLLALRTNRHGAFRFTWSYHAGRGVASYPFSIATTATESDYPYAASSSPSVRITFGRPTPKG